MTSHPLAIDDGGVELLLNRWGGESAYFSHQGDALQELLATTGTPRVLELAVPMHSTRHAGSAAGAVVATFGRTLGCRPDTGAFDLYSTPPLNADAILNIHSKGESAFATMAQGYPVGYVNLQASGWYDLE
jgi:hypothetical protein